MQGATVLTALACALAVVAAPAEPRARPAQGTADDPVSLPTVEVEASRLTLARQVRNFVETATQRADEESPAVWHVRVCPLVAGLPREQAEFVLLRLSSATSAIAAPLAPERCRANLFVVTPDPPALFAAWRKRDPGMFGGSARAAIARFVDSASPVRAWYNVSRVGADATVRDVTPSAPWRNPGDLRLSAGRLPNTRLERSTVLTLDSVLVVVEPDRLGGRTLGAVADYVAMIGLAQLRPETVDDRAPTLLNLFDARDPSEFSGMTAWDRSMLRVLYATKQKYVLQRSQMTQRMVAELASRGDYRPSAPR